MCERQGLELRADRLVLSQSLQDDVAVRMVLRFFGCQHAFFLHHVYDGLIVSQECELPPAEPIRSTVTHLCHRHDTVPHMHRRESRRHMACAPTGAVILTDCCMCRVHGAAELLSYRQDWLNRLDERPGYGLNCYLAGNLAAFMAAKTIGDHEHSPTPANIMMK
jgi:hypothetical protein